MNDLRLQSELHTFETDDNVYLVTALSVDGESVADFRIYATFLQELKQSTQASGNYFLLTCWCGIPECAGIYQAVQVLHEGEWIRWVWTQPAPPRTFIFDATAYRQAIEHGMAQIRRDVKDLLLTQSGDQEPKLKITPDLNAPLLEPRANIKLKRQHHNSQKHEAMKR